MLGLVALLFVLGNLFQNTLAYTVSFWLLALQVISIFYTYRNISGIQIRPIDNPPCFAGERAILRYRISHSGNRPAHNITLGWQDEDSTSVNLSAGKPIDVQLSYMAPHRGYLRCKRLEIQTRYPTGLAVAWSYLQFDVQTLVYPTPVSTRAVIHHRTDNSAEDNTGMPALGNTEFSGVREYQMGDSTKRVHWAKYAQTGRLYTKTFDDFQNQDYWHTWDDQQGDTEQRLSTLCALVLASFDANERYGLRLPGLEIKPSFGLKHKASCLRSLALFGNTASHA